MKLYYAIAILFSLFASVSASAATEQIPADRKIVAVYTYTGKFLIKFEPAFQSTLGCPSGSDQTLSASLSSGGHYLLSTALAAMNSNKTVGFGAMDCHDGYPKVYRVDVTNDAP